LVGSRSSVANILEGLAIDHRLTTNDSFVFGLDFRWRLMTGD